MLTAADKLDISGLHALLVQSSVQVQEVRRIKWVAHGLSATLHSGETLLYTRAQQSD